MDCNCLITDGTQVDDWDEDDVCTINCNNQSRAYYMAQLSEIIMSHRFAPPIVLLREPVEYFFIEARYPQYSDNVLINGGFEA